jgi:glycosyltransferase involved in cell wall biosynthesis
MGFQANRKIIVLPGGGGVRPEIFHPAKGDSVEVTTPTLIDIPTDVPIVVNPRGVRAYIRNDTFFASIPEILDQRPGVLFLCPSMAGDPFARSIIDRLGIANSVRLLPKLTQQEMGQIFRRASVAVSISEHDGTPNTLLEAMASGCFPIAGDIEAIREWIKHGENGYLVDPNDPTALAESVLRALSAPEMRNVASSKNAQLVQKRASYPNVMERAEATYQELIHS